MLDVNKTQNEIIDSRNRSIDALKERLKEEKEYLSAYIKTIPLVKSGGGERK